MSMLMKILPFFLFFVLKTAYSEEYIIVLSKDYPSSVDREVIGNNIVKFVLINLKRGDNLSVISNEGFKTLATFNVLDKDGYDNKNVKRKKFSRRLMKLSKYIKNIPISNDTIAHSLLSEPQLLKHLSIHNFSELTEEQRNIHILLIGNALYKDMKEPNFNMREGWFPTDGHIRANEKQSIYGTSNKNGYLKGVSLHHLVTNKDDEWFSDLYKLRIKRFWSLFLKNQGGELSTFSTDADTAFNRFSNHSKGVEIFNFDHTSDKLEMLKTRRVSVPIQPLSSNNIDDLDDAEFMNDGIHISSIAPTAIKGKLKIGISWTCTACDLDLYAKSNGASKYLYYSNVLTSEGKYFKDFTTSPNTLNGLEYIQFTRDFEMNNMDIRVNFYKGTLQGGVSGIVRAEYENKVYEKHFSISANSGNSGDKNQPDNWVIINLPELLGV